MVPEIAPRITKSLFFKDFCFTSFNLACLRGGRLADMRHTDAVGSAMRVGEHVCPPDSASGIKEVLVLKESEGAAASCVAITREPQKQPLEAGNWQVSMEEFVLATAKTDLHQLIFVKEPQQTHRNVERIWTNPKSPAHLSKHYALLKTQLPGCASSCMKLRGPSRSMSVAPNPSCVIWN